MKVFIRKPKIGLALSGGAARGLAHLGVIKAIQDEKIPISYVAGTSVGSLVGALFAGGMSWQKMVEIARKLKWKDLAGISLSGMGLASSQKLQKIIEDLLGKKKFFELNIPFAAVAVDIEKGEKVILQTGSVAEAVRASSSIPGIFEPVKISGRLLVDGGLLDNLPCSVVRQMGADLVLACDLNAGQISQAKPKNIIDILYRCFQIMLDSARQSKDDGDILITPNLSGKSYHDLKPLDEYILLGETAFKEKLNIIKRKARLK